MIITIDGPAGVGKTTLAQKIADRFSLLNLQTGIFYRAVTYFSLQKGYSPQDVGAICEVAKSLNFSFDKDELLVNGEILTPVLRTKEIDKEVSWVAGIQEVREILNQHFRDLAEIRPLVAEGRDMGTVVFPTADVAFFIDASPQKRAERRYKEEISDLSLEEIEAEIIERDRQDREKMVWNPQKAKKSLHIDTTDLTLNGVYVKMTNKILEYRSLTNG